MSVIIRLTEVTMSFGLSGAGGGDHRVLNNLDLEIKQGERIGLVGRNGAGKSTLLRIIGGIYPPAGGTVWRDPKKTVALLSLGLGFKGDLSGRDNALLAAMLQGMTRREAKQRLDAIGEFTELGDFFEQPVKTYSSGMRSRLGFATGLLLDTDILLLDEILAVGDQSFRQKARAALRERLAPDKTVILVHHMEQAIKETCQRAVWLEQGQVRDDGGVAEVLAGYAADA
ncbi:MAG: ABC transporter ATP-binding protein [Alphaproteobacteria bacterium]